MTLSECKQRMKLYRDDTTTAFNWRTTARWALRYQWACEENERLRLALQDANGQLREHRQAYNSLEESAQKCKAAQEAAYLRATIAEDAIAELRQAQAQHVELVAVFSRIAAALEATP